MIHRKWTVNPIVVDIGIVLVCFAATVLVPLKDGTAWTPDYVFAAVTAVPLLWRRRFPIPVAFLAAAGTVGLVLDDGIFHLPYGQIVATYTFAALSRPAWRIVGAVCTAVGIVTVVLLAGHHLSSAAVVSLPFVAAYVFGAGNQARRDRIAILEERERRRTEERAAVTSRERESIARDMHDILAHSISLMVVQAEAGPVVVRSDPGRAEATFAIIADTGRDTLAQLRRTIGILRAGDPSRHPQPDLDGLPGLLDRARHAGLAASIEERGDRRPVHPEVAGAAYRIVQESLTNTLKHAGARRFHVCLDWRGAGLRLSVSDDGRGPASGGQRSGQPPPGGHGLVGMGERVAACGGTLHTGPASGGGFLVDARLPVGTAGD